MPATKHLDTKSLTRISAVTIAHYNESAASFWEGTRDHDVSQNRDALLRHLNARLRPVDGPSPLRILDFGCGPGRDLLAFQSMGHAPVGLDGSIRFCEMARELTGCEVLHQDMLALDLPAAHFHGVFANASLFHVPTQELPQVIGHLHTTLVDSGVLFASNPRGQNDEGWSGERYGAWHDHESWRAMVTACGFEELEHYYRPPGLPRQQQPWLATIYRKIASPG